MNTITFTTRQVDTNAFEVVMTACYPQVIKTCTTQAQAQGVADNLTAAFA